MDLDVKREKELMFCVRVTDEDNTVIILNDGNWKILEKNNKKHMQYHSNHKNEIKHIFKVRQVKFYYEKEKSNVGDKER